MSAALILSVLGLGVAKVMVGLDRERPVTLLIAEMFAAFVLLVMAASSLPRRTRVGDAVITAAEARHREPDLEPDQRNAEAMALAVAMFGPTLLAGTVLEDLRPALRPLEYGTAGGSGSSSGGSCGSSCGGGGCGGGGCGGCGGG